MGLKRRRLAKTNTLGLYGRCIRTCLLYFVTRCFLFLLIYVYLLVSVYFNVFSAVYVYVFFLVNSIKKVKAHKSTFFV